LIAFRALCAAVRIGVTVPEPELATQAVLPFGVIAMYLGSRPTLIVFRILLGRVRIGVTVPEPEFGT